MKTLILRKAYFSRDCIEVYEAVDEKQEERRNPEKYFARFYAVGLDNHYLLCIDQGRNIEPMGIEDYERFPLKKEDKERIESRLVKMARSYAKETASINKFKLVDKIEQK